MLHLKRPLASAGAAVLLALSLTACGGGAPSDASTKDFCKFINDTGDEEFFKALQEEDYDKLADLFHEQAKEAEKVGTPKGIPDDAREGFEIQVEALKDIDAATVKKAFEAKDADKFEDELLSKDEQKKVEALSKYQEKKCAGAAAPESDDTATDLPTDSPTDYPTSPEDIESLLSDLPSELPSDLASLLSDAPTQ